MDAGTGILTCLAIRYLHFESGTITYKAPAIRIFARGENQMAVGCANRRHTWLAAAEDLVNCPSIE